MIRRTTIIVGAAAVAVLTPAAVPARSARATSPPLVCVTAVAAGAQLANVLSAKINHLRRAGTAAVRAANAEMLGELATYNQQNAIFQRQNRAAVALDPKIVLLFAEFKRLGLACGHS